MGPLAFLSLHRLKVGQNDTPQVPSNEDRLRAWYAMKPVEVVPNNLPWKWRRQEPSNGRSQAAAGAE